MKKSELKKYIKENILSTLSESTEDEIEKTKELTSAVKDLNTAKKEAGIEEAYGSRMPSQAQVDKFFALTQNEMHYLNSKPVRGQEKTFNNMEVEPWDEYDLSNFNSLVRKAKQRGKSIDENEDEDVVKYKGEDHVITRRDGDRIYLRRKEDAVILGKMPEFWVKSQDINENEDAEPTKKDIKKTKGLAKAKEELALLTREMKSLAKKYSKAEGEEKEKLVKTLKAKTKLKKELESILDKKKI